tara:strand:+ start:1210 stop:1734 length:525 start_codon:yes stop_codon:yes gene_type:complete
MKYFVKLFVVTLIVLVSKYAFADHKVVFLDMKYILNNSKAGKGAQDYLQKTFKENQKKFSDKEKELKDEEKDLLKNKTVLSKEEYQKRTDELRKKVIDYQSQRRLSLEKISKQRAEARKKLIEELDPILDKYINENSISLVIDKKNMVMGNKDLDITNTIVDLLNKELPSISLK